MGNFLRSICMFIWNLVFLLFNSWSLNLSLYLVLNLAHNTAHITECFRLVNLHSCLSWRACSFVSLQNFAPFSVIIWTNIYWSAPKLCPFLCDYLNIYILERSKTLPLSLWLSEHGLERLIRWANHLNVFSIIKIIGSDNLMLSNNYII